jgi:hypothetical protein
LFRFTPGFQPEIVPSKDAKIKAAGDPGANSKFILPLNTIPVGLPIVV